MDTLQLVSNLFTKLAIHIPYTNFDRGKMSTEWARKRALKQPQIGQKHNQHFPNLGFCYLRILVLGDRKNCITWVVDLRLVELYVQKRTRSHVDRPWVGDKQFLLNLFTSRTPLTPFHSCVSINNDDWLCSCCWLEPLLLFGLFVFCWRKRAEEEKRKKRDVKKLKG